jgi:hypothetical protein
LLTLLFSCATVKTQKESGYDANDIVRWTDSTKLSWDDFTGKVPANTTLGSEIIVLIPAEFYEPVLFNSATATIECFMVKNASWVVKSKAKKQLLAYNQILFDINELAARKLRKKIAETDFSRKDPVGLFNRIRNEHMKTLENTISEYRSDTEIGMNSKKLMEWEEKIAQELSGLEDFKHK